MILADAIAACLGQGPEEIRLLDLVARLLTMHGLRNPLVGLQRGQVTPASTRGFLSFADRAQGLGITPRHVLRTLQGDARFQETWVEINDPMIAVPLWSLK